MTTIKITLPDQLKERRIDQLFSAMERMGTAAEPAPMSAEQVAEELAAMRAESRANRPT